MATSKPSKARQSATAAVDKKRNPGQQKASARRRKAPTQEPLPFTDADVNKTLFPLGNEIKISTGTVHKIKPWSITMFGEMAQRIPKTFELALEGDEESDGQSVYGAVFYQLIDEVVFMVSGSIGVDEEEIREEMSMDDLLLLSIGVWDNCIAGPMGKVQSLMGRVTTAVAGENVLAAVVGARSRTSNLAKVSPQVS